MCDEKFALVEATLIQNSLKSTFNDSPIVYSLMNPTNGWILSGRTH